MPILSGNSTTIQRTSEMFESISFQKNVLRTSMKSLAALR